MRIVNRESAVRAVGLICGVVIFLSAVAAPPHTKTALWQQEIVLALDPAQCKIRYTVDSSLHTVHGTFNLKSGTMRFDPDTGKAGGEIVVLATSGDSGNSSRDDRMHKEILESGKYPDAIFRPTQIEGKVAATGASDTKLHGTIVLHGQEHEIVVPVHADLSADHWNGTAHFDIPYIQWGLKDASNWILKVKPLVSIDLEMSGTTKISH
jgi:polyisoprenoid-binding protein YceI